MPISPVIARTKLLTACCTALLVVGTSPAIAETPAAAPTTMPLTELDPAHRLIDLQMPEITVRDYVDYLAEVSGANFILLNDPQIDPSQVKVPALKLKQMSVEAALKLLTALPGSNIDVQPDAGTKVPSYVITMHAAPGAPATQIKAASLIVTRLFPLERLLVPAYVNQTAPQEAEHAKALDERVDQLLQLIDLAIATQGDDSPRPLVKLHQPTHTLLVKGTPAQIDSVEQAIKALTIDPSDQAAEEVRNARAKLDAVVTGSQIRDQEIAQLRAQNEALKRALDEIRGKNAKQPNAGPSTQPTAPVDVN